MLIGYTRVSITGQNLESQIEHLQGEGCNTIFQEKLTGLDRLRPQLEKILGLSEQRYKPTTGLCRISNAHDALSGSAFTWVHAVTEELLLPGPYPNGKQNSEAQAALEQVLDALALSATKLRNLTRMRTWLSSSDGSFAYSK